MADHLSWTSHLFRAFFDAGIRHIYISPGSRSTPLALAVAYHPGFISHIVLDERSAAFQALGSAKATGNPAILICTSGTALANYHPSLVEAKYSGVPMILITADRPPHLRGTGSSQTIDQIKLFSDTAVMFHELGEPVHKKQDFNRLTLLAKQAVENSIHLGGAVHINAPFRKPLEPGIESIEKEETLNREQVNRCLKIPEKDTTGPDIPTQKLPDDLADIIAISKNPLLIIGPEEKNRSLKILTRQLAAHLKIPVVAEPGSHINPDSNVMDRYDILLNNKDVTATLKPDLILKAGDQPFSKSLQDFESAHRDIPVAQLLTRHSWQDSLGTTDLRIVMQDMAPDLSNFKARDKTWLKKWGEANSNADLNLKVALEESGELTDGHVYHHFTEQISSDWDIISSNSFTVRDLSLFGQGLHRISNTYVNRGAAGIDGVMSTAAGIQQTNNRNTAVFIGDLAFLHDSNALLSLRQAGHPLAVIILNNNGGNIFRMLPVYKDKKNFRKYFETPQQVDISGFSKVHKIPYYLIDSVNSLYNFNLHENVRKGPALIECKTDPARSMELRNILWNKQK